MRNISSWAIRNPVFPLVLFAALSLLGLVSFLRMDVNNNPDISFPAATVTVVQPGAAPSELETQVTQRVEAAIRGINGVDEIQSTAREGSSSTFVQFDMGTPVDRAVNDVRDAIANIRSRPSRRNPRAAGRARRGRRRADRLHGGRIDRRWGSRS